MTVLKWNSYEFPKNVENKSGSNTVEVLNVTHTFENVWDPWFTEYLTYWNRWRKKKKVWQEKREKTAFSDDSRLVFVPLPMCASVECVSCSFLAFNSSLCEISLFPLPPSRSGNRLTRSSAETLYTHAYTYPHTHTRARGRHRYIYDTGYVIFVPPGRDKNEEKRYTRGLGETSSETPLSGTYICRLYVRATAAESNRRTNARACVSVRVCVRAHRDGRARACVCVLYIYVCVYCEVWTAGGVVVRAHGQVLKPWRT